MKNKRDEHGRFAEGNDAGSSTQLGPDWPGQRCGAHRKFDGQPCQNPAMPNGRCRLHGGKSTGPKTPEGKARMRHAVTKHGLYVGPDHPDYDTPGPRWRDPEMVKIRSDARAAIRLLKKEGVW